MYVAVLVAGGDPTLCVCASAVCVYRLLCFGDAWSLVCCCCGVQPQEDWIHANGENWDHPKALKHDALLVDVLNTLLEAFKAGNANQWPASVESKRVLWIDGFMVRTHT